MEIRVTRGARGHRLDPGLRASASGGDAGALHLGPLGAADLEGDAGPLERSDAAGMEDLGPHRGELLGLIVVQMTQHAGRGDTARVGRVQAWHVGPDLDLLRLEAGTEVGRRGVRAASAQEHGFALDVGGDEPLGQVHRLGHGHPLLEGGVRGGGAGGGEVASLRGVARDLLGSQKLAGVPPARRQFQALEVGRSQAGGHDLAGGHHPSLQAWGGLAGEGEPRGQSLQGVEVLAQQALAVHLQVAGERQVALADLGQTLGVPALQGSLPQGFQAIGDAGEGRADDQRAEPFGQAFANLVGDGGPTGGGGDARPPELHDDPAHEASHSPGPPGILVLTPGGGFRRRRPGLRGQSLSPGAGRAPLPRRSAPPEIR